MVHEHWFDDLSKTAVQAASRREISRSLAALFSALLLGGLGDSATAKRKKGKRNGKGKDRGSGKSNKKPRKPRKPEPPAPPPPPPPASDICDTTWPGEGNEANRNHCRFIRRQCDGADPRDFCIETRVGPTGVHKVAVCCPDGDPTCCNGQCVDLKFSDAHCGVCGKACGIGEFCQDGKCVSFCGPGGTPCPGAGEQCCRAGKTCCNGRCIDTTADDNNCGQRGNVCRKPGSPRHEVCVGGDCVCWAAGAVWDESCGGCNQPDLFTCCDAFGNACPITHDCVVLGSRPNGDPIWGCAGRAPQP